MYRSREILENRTFNNLEVIEWVGKTQNNIQLYRCKCLLCGNDQHVVRSTHLKAGTIKACSCNDPTVNKEKWSNPALKHGLCRKDWQDKIWDCWHFMLTRLGSTEHKKHYSNVKIQDSWLPENDGFVNFYNWLLGKYPNAYELLENSYSLDRKNNNEGYFDWNCRLATKKQQIRNRRNTLKALFRGEMLALADIYESLPNPEVSYRLFTIRIKSGYTIEDAIYTPKQRGHQS